MVFAQKLALRASIQMYFETHRTIHGECPVCSGDVSDFAASDFAASDFAASDFAAMALFSA
jgi:hypothetical protein